MNSSPTALPPSAGDALPQRVAQHWPPRQWQDVTLAIAVSGGADSIGLLHALASLRPANARGELVVLHYDHQLRDGSAEDAQFVRQQADLRGLRCRIGRAQQPPHDRSEAAAREARYAFFCDACSQLGARYLATGHTADDQAETILHRILRGTGLRGLSGIAFLRSLNEMTSLVRPLLQIQRDEVREYLRSASRTWREDPSNQSPRFTRNRLRHQLLPQLLTYNPQISAALRWLGQQAAEQQALVESLAESLLTAAICEPDNRTLDCQVLGEAPPLVASEALRLLWRRLGWPEGSMSRQSWRRLVDLIGPAVEENHAVEFPNGCTARRNGRLLRLQRK